MRFLDDYNRNDAMTAIAAILDGNAITVRQYNQIVAYLAGARDYINDPRRFQRARTNEMSWPVVQGRGLLGESRLAPVVGATEPLPFVTSQGDNAYSSLAYRSSVLSDAIGNILRRLRSGIGIEQPSASPGSTAASGQVALANGPVVIVGEAAGAALDDTGLSEGARVRVDRTLAQAIATVTRGAASLSSRVSSWIRTERLDAPVAQENVAVEASLWLSEQYRSEVLRTSAIAGVTMVGFGILAATLGGLFDRFRKGQGDNRAQEQEQTKTIIASQPQQLVPTTIFGTPASGVAGGLGVLG